VESLESNQTVACLVALHENAQVFLTCVNRRHRTRASTRRLPSHWRDISSSLSFNPKPKDGGQITELAWPLTGR